MPKQSYTIDGEKFSTLEEFYDEISTTLIPGAVWERNLDNLSSVIRGFGTPDEGLDLRWKHSDLSRERLGYPETVRQLETRLLTCPPSEIPVVTLELARARLRQGPTVFNWLVGIIADQMGVNLILE